MTKIKLYRRGGKHKTELSIAASNELEEDAI